MDAISFVLGEKTSKLRVKKVKDLIHRPADKSLPITRASVEATFTANYNETNDIQTLIFSRSIKQSGSTYCFNNLIVPENVYIEKLKLCGMNVEFPNFLVFQGDITKIALQNPIELRRYFEYIVGSTDLAKQYEELSAESKILFDESNLLGDQKRNTNKALHKALATNKEYKMYLDAKIASDDKMRLKELICLFYLDKSIKDFTEQFAPEEEDKLLLRNQLEEIQKKLSENRAVQKVISKEVEELYQQKEKKQADMTKRKFSVLQFKETSESAIKKMKHCMQQIDIEENKLNLVDSKKKDIEKKINDITEKKKKYPIKTKSVEHEKQYQKLCNESALICGKKFNIDNEVREDQADNDNIDTLHIQLEALKGILKAKKDRKIIAVERVKKLNVKLTELRNVLFNAEQRASDDTCRELRKKIKEHEEKLRDKREKQSDIEESKHIERMNNVLQELKCKIYGVFDRVTNCCNVSDVKYKKALTKVVASQMKAIIVDTENTAVKCIKYLREMKYPRQTFLPIHFVKAKQFKRANISSAVLLKDVLVYDHKYENIMEFVCKGTYVCEDERKLQALYKARINVVNLDGTFYQRSGLISGGSVELERRSHLWIAQTESQEPDNLTQELNDLRRELANKECQRHDLVDVEKLKAIIDAVERDIIETERDRAKLDQEIISHRSEIEKIVTKIDGFKERTANRRSFFNEINQVEEELFRDFCTSLKIENISEYRNMEQNILNIDSELRKFKCKLDMEKEVYNSIEENIKDLKKQLRERQQAVENINHDDVTKSYESTCSEMKIIKKKYESKLHALEEADNNARTNEKKYTELKQTIEKVRLKYNKIEDNIAKLKKQFNIEFARCNMELIDIPLIQGMNSQEPSTDYYSKIIIDYDQIPKKYRGYNNIEDEAFRKLLDKLGDDIKSLRKQLKEGERYLIKHGKGRDEYIESLRSKLTAIEEQHKDVLLRYQSHKKTIANCAQERNNRLLQLVNNVKTLIKPMYSELTGNTTGNVFIDFENLENPFAGGITFNVIVPEKPYMSLESLSGGEISMAGILLLLAIQKYSRCPILILDEIDAALDSIYAVKLFEYLGKISVDLQIFLITHNVEVYKPAQLLVGFTKNCVPETVLKSKVIMLSCEKYEQNSFHESDISSTS